MPEDRNLEILTIIHSLTNSSQEMQYCLDVAVSNTTGENIEIPTTVAVALSSLLSLQSGLVAAFVEENQEIKDQAELLLKRLESH